MKTITATLMLTLDLLGFAALLVLLAQMGLLHL